MLPRDLRPRNAARRSRTRTPVGSRDLKPRDPVVLPTDEYDRTGPDFFDCEWEPDRPLSALSRFLDQDEGDDGPLTARPGAAASSHQQLTEPHEHESTDTGGPAAPGSIEDDLYHQPAEAEFHATTPETPDAEPIPMTPEELLRLRKRDERVVKRLRDEDRKRFRTITEPGSLAGASNYFVACFGAALRLSVEAKADARAELYHSPLDGTRESRLAQLREALAAVARGRQKVAAYDAWVAGNRPELADDELLERLAGSKDDRAAAKARLRELDRQHHIGTAKRNAAAAPADPGSLPLVYQEEFQGQVRAYPGWVAPVLRKVTARKQAHRVPAMAFVLAQLAYWMRPADATGRPRAKRAKLISGKWWVVLGYGAIEKQTPVSKGQARRAVEHLAAVGLIETLSAEAANVGSDAGGVNYGPNTVFLRVNVAVLDPLVREAMSGESKSGFEEPVGASRTLSVG